MYLGFSKNLGKGFRIAMGTKVGGKKPQKTTKSAKDIQQETGDRITNEINTAYYNFFEANGIVKDMVEKIDIHEAFKDNQEVLKDAEILTKLFAKAEEICEKISMVRSMSAARRDKLVDIAFEMKKIADKYEISEPQSQDIEWTQENTSTDTKKSILIAISVIVILLFILIVAL